MNRPGTGLTTIASRRAGSGRWHWRHLARRLGRITFDSLVVWGSVALHLLPPNLAGPALEDEQPADSRASGRPLSADEQRWLLELAD